MPDNDPRHTAPGAWQTGSGIDRAIFAFQQNLSLTPRGKDLVTHNLYAGLLSMARELAHMQRKIDLLSLRVK